MFFVMFGINVSHKYIFYSGHKRKNIKKWTARKNELSTVSLMVLLSKDYFAALIAACAAARRAIGTRNGEQDT